MATVVLLHTDREVGRRIGETLASVPQYQLAGVADSLGALRDVFARGLPDVLVVDLMLRPDHVRALLQSLRGNGQFGRPLILALAMAADDPRLIEALRHGADGYFVHTRSAESLPAAIEQLIHGESTMSPQVARLVKAQLDAKGWHETVFGGDTQNPWRLTEADQLLLQWTSEGYLVNEVARGLQISVGAVGVRMRHIYRKLQFDCRAKGEGPRSRGSTSDAIGLGRGLDARA
jgi:DNA-binding NarL/FixJ family response regulator